jgi:HAD superfamily hydrolase (TIGR01549 family)
MKEITRVEAVLVDGMGTLLRLLPPAPVLSERLGVDLATAELAFRAEVAYYLEHQSEGKDTASLDDLRRRCAAVLAEAAAVDGDGALEALLASLRFEAFADAAPALAVIRARGTRVVVVSNWDYSLSEVLERVGLGDELDAVVVSAVVGAKKPDRRIYDAALAAAGCGPAEALHVGDSVVDDVAGARAAGIEAVLLQREGEPPDGSFRAIRSLSELPALLS